MKHITKFYAVAAIAILLSACNSKHNEPHFNYVVKGRVIDKVTQEPIKDILVSFEQYHLPNPEDRQRTRLSPPEYDSWSDEKGNFRAFHIQWRTPLYFYDYYGYENGFYKDTTISVDFKDVPLSGIPHGNYKGSYVLNIGDVELEKIE